MSFASHRTAEGRAFDCFYDPSFILPSNKDVQQASASAVSNSAPIRVYTKFNAMFANAPKELRLTYKRLLNPLSFGQERLSGGEDITNDCTNYCTKATKATGNFFSYYVHPPKDRNVINIKLSEDISHPYQQAERRELCVHEQKAIRPRWRSRTRETQTRYRESSAQTHPYLPDIANDEERYDDLEIYKLSKLLKGDKPPGEYEVQILERARKRWKLERALKANLQQRSPPALPRCGQLSEVQHTQIIEAFEWEEWISREEDIQACQMLRLEIVCSIFEKREREMHDASRIRIEQSNQILEAKRLARLHKIDVEYGRSMRRLEIKHQKLPRTWRKENITLEMTNPASDLHAPQMRYGVNPNRRHYVGYRRDFDARMDVLEKKVQNFKPLTCHFAKLNELSKPKERIREVSKRFYSNNNLKKLYESLSGLRNKLTMTKSVKCLRKKSSPKQMDISTKEQPSPRREQPVDREFTAELQPNQPQNSETSHQAVPADSQSCEMAYIANCQMERMQELLAKNDNNVRIVLAEYEGSTVGCMVKFLSDELQRLQEQRKMQAIYMLAQRERWKRQAVEAASRQRESELRDANEQLYAESAKVHNDTTATYLENVLVEESHLYANSNARTRVEQLACKIDADIERLSACNDELPCGLNRDEIIRWVKELFYPDIQKTAAHLEAKTIVQKEIDETMMPQFESALEASEIVNDVLSEVISGVQLCKELDREQIIQWLQLFIAPIVKQRAQMTAAESVHEVLFGVLQSLFESDTLVSDASDSSNVDENALIEEEREARSIINDLLMRTIPGDKNKRKKSPEEIVESSIEEILDEILASLNQSQSSNSVTSDKDLEGVLLHSFRQLTNLKRTVCTPTKKVEIDLLPAPDDNSYSNSSIQTSRTSLAYSTAKDATVVNFGDYLSNLNMSLSQHISEFYRRISEMKMKKITPSDESDDSSRDGESNNARKRYDLAQSESRLIQSKYIDSHSSSSSSSSSNNSSVKQSEEKHKSTSPPVAVVVESDMELYRNPETLNIFGSDRGHPNLNDDDTSSQEFMKKVDYDKSTEQLEEYSSTGRLTSIASNINLTSEYAGEHEEFSWELNYVQEVIGQLIEGVVALKEKPSNDLQHNPSYSEPIN